MSRSGPGKLRCGHDAFIDAPDDPAHDDNSNQVACIVCLREREAELAASRALVAEKDRALNNAIDENSSLRGWAEQGGLSEEQLSISEALYIALLSALALTESDMKEKA